VQRHDTAGKPALRRKSLRYPKPELGALIDELEPLVPSRGRELPASHLGFAVPLRLRDPDGELELLTTLAHFATAVDVTVSELSLEASFRRTPSPRPTSHRRSRRHPW
jgi:hypothetical protein